MRYLAAALLLSALLVSAQDAPKQDAPKQGGGGGRAPRNLKILKPEDLRAGVMRQYTQALGQGCDFCHVQDRAADDNPKKLVARKMIEMANNINTGFGDSKVHVTCYTCHHGKNIPETTAPAAVPGQ